MFPEVEWLSSGQYWCLSSFPITFHVYISRCLSAVEALAPENEDQKKGIAIVKYALTRPLYTIADNAGLDASVIVNQVTNCGNVNEGFDAANEKMVDMINAGIIDPAKVVRTALTDASGVASLLCTAEVMRTGIGLLSF